MNADISARWSAYPENAQEGLKNLRAMMFSVACELGDASALQESLKWNEASYAYPGGSPVRMDWKAKTPGSLWLFFHCQSQLVPTFRELYPDTFIFHARRAIELPMDVRQDEAALKSCLRHAFRYHSVKHLPTRGFKVPPLGPE